MRIAVGAMALLAVLALALLTRPDPSMPDSTGAVIPDPTSTLTVERGSRTEASLPNGTQFVVTVDPGVADDWVATTAGIVVEVDGELLPAGRLRFFRDVPNSSYLYEDGRYRLPAAGLLVVLDLDPATQLRLGTRVEETVTQSIRATSESGHPVLRLREPFRWASDELLQEVMAVRFSTFEVRRGCSELAAACSPEGSLQVIWRAPEFESAPPLEQPEVRIFRLVP